MAGRSTPLVKQDIHGSGESPPPAPGGVDSRAGWLVVATLTTILMMTNGARMIYGIVLKPISDQYGWDRATMSFAVVLGMVSLSLFQPLIGLVIDRIGPKIVVVGGSLVLGLAILPLSAANQIWQVYLFWGVLSSIGLAAASPVNATAFVSRWFEKKRALALSIATSGSAFGQLLVVPLAAFLLTITNWETTFRVAGLLLIFVVAPAGWLLLRDGPVGQDAAAIKQSLTGVVPRAAFRSLDFWVLAFGFFVCGWTMAFPNIHFLAFADDMGMSLLHAANAISVTAVFSIGGSLLLGIMADRHRATWVLSLVYALRGIAFVLLLVLPLGNMVFLYAVVLGISWTATTPLTAAIAADRFGRRNLGVIFGFMFSFMNIGFGAGAFIDGLIFDANGSYQFALYSNVILGVLAAGAVLLVDRAPRLGFNRASGPTVSGAGAAD